AHTGTYSAMTDDPSGSSATRNQERSWLERMLHSFSNEPKSRDDLLEIIKDAAENKLLDQEALNIIEGALDVSVLQAREIMIPRTQIVAVKLDDKPQEFLPKII